MSTPSYYTECLIKHAFNWGTPLRYMGRKAQGLVNRFAGSDSSKLGLQLRFAGQKGGRKLDSVQRSAQKLGGEIKDEWGAMNNMERLKTGGILALPPAMLAGAAVAQNNANQNQGYVGGPNFKLHPDHPLSRQGSAPMRRDEMLEFIRRNMQA